MAFKVHNAPPHCCTLPDHLGSQVLAREQQLQGTFFMEVEKAPFQEELCVVPSAQPSTSMFLSERSRSVNVSLLEKPACRVLKVHQRLGRIRKIYIYNYDYADLYPLYNYHLYTPQLSSCGWVTPSTFISRKLSDFLLNQHLRTTPLNGPACLRSRPHHHNTAWHCIKTPSLDLLVLIGQRPYFD